MSEQGQCSEDTEAPDTRGPAIVVTGGVAGGFTFHGPFKSIDVALRWYEQSLFGLCGASVTIALLEKPDQQSGDAEKINE